MRSSARLRARLLARRLGCHRSVSMRSSARLRARLELARNLERNFGFRFYALFCASQSPTPCPRCHGTGRTKFLCALLRVSEPDVVVRGPAALWRFYALFCASQSPTRQGEAGREGERQFLCALLRVSEPDSAASAHNRANQTFLCALLRVSEPDFRQCSCRSPLSRGVSMRSSARLRARLHTIIVENRHGNNVSMRSSARLRARPYPVGTLVSSGIQGLVSRHARSRR